MFDCSLDFDALAEVSFDIASAWCVERSEWLEKVMSGSLPSDEVSALYHFHLQMIAPGGAIDCAAAGFEIQLGEFALWS